MTAPEGAEDEEIEETLKQWAQGDCVVGKQGFFCRAGTNHSSGLISVPLASGEIKIATSEEAGLMVLTQTCDIVRDPKSRPFVETSPLVEVGESVLHQIKRGYRPGYAFVSGLEEQRLVADLDRVMTIEKRVMVKWERVVGCITDDDRHRLAQALARKRSRFAFPDDFTKLIKPLSELLKGLHDTDEDEGEAIRSLREIRVRAEPSWTAERIQLLFFFIPEKKQLLDGEKKLNNYLEDWLELIPRHERYIDIAGLVMDMDRLSASAYTNSAQLDLDYLTSRAPRDTRSTAS